MKRKLYIKKKVLEKIIAKKNFSNIKIIKRHKIPSSKLTYVEIVRIFYNEKKYDVIIKTVNLIWEKEISSHKISYSLLPKFIPVIYSDFIMKDKIVYIQKKISIRKKLVKNDINNIIELLLLFYKKSQSYNNIIELKWLQPLNDMDIENLQYLTKIITIELGEKQEMTQEEIFNQIFLLVSEYKKISKTTLIHNDLYVNQFLLSSKGKRIYLSDWSFMMTGHPIIDIASLLRDDPDKRNEQILPYRDYFIDLFNSKSYSILGFKITNEKMILWRKWQCLRDILWFYERKRKGLILNEPLSSWSHESSLEFQFLCLSKSKESWKLSEKSWLI